MHKNLLWVQIALKLGHTQNHYCQKLTCLYAAKDVHDGSLGVKFSAYQEERAATSGSFFKQIQCVH
jgi:hypothetical protein